MTPPHQQLLKAPLSRPGKHHPPSYGLDDFSQFVLLEQTSPLPVLLPLAHIRPPSSPSATLNTK